MNRTHYLAGRLREVLLNGHWIARTNYRELLQQVHWQQAVMQVNNLNSIARLVFHVNYYLEGLLQVFRGGPLSIKDKYSFDLPPIASAEDWDRLTTRFLANAEAFAHAVETMPGEQLDAIFVDAAYGTWLRNIEAVIEHSYYHMGQIALLQKMLNNTATNTTAGQ